MNEEVVLHLSESVSTIVYCKSDTCSVLVKSDHHPEVGPIYLSQGRWVLTVGPAEGLAGNMAIMSKKIEDVA